MPADLTGFKKVVKGFKWNKHTKTAHFEVWGPSKNGHRKRVRTTLQFSSVEEARQSFESFRQQVKLSAIKGHDGENESESARPIKFREYVERYGEDSVWCRCTTETKKRYRSLVDNMLNRYFGEMWMHDIGDISVIDFVGWCLAPTDKRTGEEKTVYAPYSINNGLRRLREIMRNAAKRGTIASVPQIELLEEPEIRLEFTPEEREAFLDAFEDREGFLRMYASTRWSRAQTELIDVEPWHYGVKFGDTRYGRNPHTKEASKRYDLFRASKVWFLAALDTGLRRGHSRIFRAGPSGSRMPS